MSINFDDILTEYDTEDDFGFSSISEEEYNKTAIESEYTIESYKQKLIDLEKLILPFLTKLLKTADNPYIHWPNRGPSIQKQIEKILSITRN